MGEAKRRKALLGENYGKANIEEQCSYAWKEITKSIEVARENEQPQAVVMCTRRDKGFHPSAITTMKQQMKESNFSVEFEVSIYLLPENTPCELDSLILIWSNSQTIEP